ncbi:MAG: ferritin-like domain-containing protein [Pseudomonadota bacterium]
MKLRTRLDVFSTALLSALGATQLVACGGSAALTTGSGGGSGDTSSAGASGSSAAGSNAAGSSAAGSSAAGSSAAGSSAAGSAPGGAGPVGVAGSAGAGNNKYPCANPRDLGNGLIQCDGFNHRQEPGMCASLVPRPEAVPDHSPDMMSQCKFDADCKEHPYGWCSNISQGNESFCAYGCVKDSDCADDLLCECGEPVGRCVPADCKSNADCQGGFLCKAYDSSGGCGLTRYTCQSASDTCGSDLDCAGPTEQCRFDAIASRFRCIPGTCAIGRPFLVDGVQRLAPVATRTDWKALALLPKLTELDATLSAHLAEQWTQVALMEHASIAAFARFTLQLMSLGAPASLIERATAAMVDETKHARACFAVASGYANAPLGPGCLAVERSLGESSLLEVVLNTIREGCVGETVAAIEAREAAEHACDPALRELLLLISEDETRHAELAYRFVKWALAQGCPALARAVRREFAELAGQTQAAHPALTDLDDDLLRHGIVPGAMRQAIRARAFAEVILPCSHALFTTEARTPLGENASV